MNNPVKKEHPEWFNDDDVAYYDQMMALGRTQIGKEIGKNEEFLLDMSAIITLKQMKGMIVDIDDPSILELKRIHKEFQEKGLVFETPPDEWYASAEALKKPYIPDEVQKEMDELNANTSNLIIEDKKTSNIENEVAEAVDDDKLKENWVKLLVAPP
jgi:hypothetical protein